MNAVSLGPLVLAADRFAAILGIFTFLIVCGLIARRVDGRFNSWSFWALVGGIVAARLGHVALNWETFSQEPARIVALWQGGFHLPTALVAIALSLLLLPGWSLRLWALLPIALSLVAVNTATQLIGDARAIPLPAGSYQTLSGGVHDLESRTGTPKVINLWATWCPPCRREMPMMADVAASSPGAEFIFANQGESRAMVEQYLGRNGIALDTVYLDTFRDLARHYGAPGLPATLFIGADGVLKHAHLGEISRETLLDRIRDLQPDDN